MSSSNTIGSPIPLSDIESVLAWVDTYKLTKPTKKIHRDFSDAVLLAEILCVHFPKMVDMHNYPPRNSQALKLNNWMTLNRKVLKKLKLTLCTNTMEQLANSTPGIIERVLVMVRDKIRRYEEQNKSTVDGDQNMSSGGSYYEACGDDENVLMVPVKTRVNGVLETVHQKVVSYDLYLTMKQQVEDAKESNELLKQKVEHLDNLLKLKEERISELQKQLERKQARRKDAEMFHSILNIPMEPEPPTPTVAKVAELYQRQSIADLPREKSKISVNETRSCKNIYNMTQITIVDKEKGIHIDADVENNEDIDVDRIQSNVFKEIETDDEGHERITTIEDTIQQEIEELEKPMEKNIPEITYIN